MIDETHYFALSNAFEQISDIPEICNLEIRLIFSRRFYCHRALLITMNDLPKSLQNIKFNFRIFNTLIDSGQYIKSMDLISTYVTDALKNFVSEAEIKTTVGNAIYTIIAVFEDNDLNEESVRHFKLNCFDLIESSLTDIQFKNRLNTIVDDFRILIDNYHLDSKDEPINKLLLYVKEHYNEPLSLQDLVDHFGFSYSYLSSYFANQSNGTFTEHLNRVRIEKACELLNDPTMSISQITEKVGYSDQSYFSKVFKKQTGITPREYRKR